MKTLLICIFILVGTGCLEAAVDTTVGTTNNSTNTASNNSTNNATNNSTNNATNNCNCPNKTPVCDDSGKCVACTTTEQCAAFDGYPNCVNNGCFPCVANREEQICGVNKACHFGTGKCSEYERGSRKVCEDCFTNADCGTDAVCVQDEGRGFCLENFLMGCPVSFSEQQRTSVDSEEVSVCGFDDISAGCSVFAE